MRIARLQFVGQLVQLAAAGHLPGQLVQRDVLPGWLPDIAASLEQDEAVAHQVGVVRVVGDEDDAEAARRGRAAMYFSTTPDCLTPSAAVGSSRMSTLAPK